MSGRDGAKRSARIRPIADAVRIDLTDSASFAQGHPFAQYAWLREHAPVYRHPEAGGPGFWALTRAADVRAVGRDAQTFSSEPTIMIRDAPTDVVDGVHKMMLMADPPVHTALRRLIRDPFTPRRAKAGWAERVAALATTIVDEVVERGECDLVADLAGEMPSLVVAEMFGLPHALGRDLYQLTEVFHSAPGTVRPERELEAMAQMFETATGVWRRLTEGPPEDATAWLRGLPGADVLGRPFDAVDFSLFFLLMVDAGGDTTRNLVAGGMDVLFRHPEALAWLRDDLDARLDVAIEELLRRVSPVVHMRRTATRDTEIAGQPVAAGDKVVLFYGAANHDPAAFDRPETLDLARQPNEHLAFGGGGPHFCLGAHLGRIEIRALLHEILTRLDDLEPAGPTEWLPSIFISGPARLPVRFRPGRRIGAE